MSENERNVESMGENERNKEQMTQAPNNKLILEILKNQD